MLGMSLALNPDTEIDVNAGKSSEVGGHVICSELAKRKSNEHEMDVESSLCVGHRVDWHADGSGVLQPERRPMVKQRSDRGRWRNESARFREEFRSEFH